MEIGSFIKERRKSLGLSLLDVGSAINYSPQAISRYESGAVNVDLALANDLAKVLQASLRCFLDADLDHIEPYSGTKDFDISSFSKAFKFYKEKNLFSQSDLSSKLNVSKTKISKWEREESLPSISEFKNICSLFNIDYETLYFGKVEEVSEQKKEENEYTPQLFLPRKRNWITIALSVFVAVGLLASIASNIYLGITRSNQNGISNNGNGGYDYITNEDNYHKVTYIYKYNGNEVEQFRKEKNVYDGRLASILSFKEEGYHLNPNNYTYLDGAIYDFNVPVTRDITLETEILKNEYEVSFFDSNKKLIGKPQTVFYEEAATPPELESAPDYQFSWDKDDYKCVKENLFIYTVKKKTNSLLYIDLNGGEFVDPASSNMVENYSSLDFDSLPKVKKKGNEFTYFTYKDEIFSSTTKLDERMVIKANYTPREFTITFTSGILEPIKATYLDHIELPTVSSSGRKIAKYFVDDKEIKQSFVYDYEEDLVIDLLFEGVNYDIEQNSDGSVTLNSISDMDSPNFILPYSIDGAPISRLGSNCFSSNPNLEKVVINHNLSIASSAFNNLENLTEVKFNETTTDSIFDDYIFSSCPNLKFLTLGCPVSSVTKAKMKLEKYGIESNPELEIAFNKYVTSLPNYYGNGVNEIKSLRFGNNFCTLPLQAFSNSMKIKQIYPGKGMQSMGILQELDQDEMVFSSSCFLDFGMGYNNRLDRLTFLGGTATIHAFSNYYITHMDLRRCSSVTFSSYNHIADVIDLPADVTIYENTYFTPKEGKTLTINFHGRSKLPYEFLDYSPFSKPESTIINFYQD